MNDILLITGSRDATDTMLTYTRRAVDRAHQRGWWVIVGDAYGVDAAAARAAKERGILLCVYGANNSPRPRHGIIGHDYRPTPGTYTERDLRMVKICTRCLAVWNGRSRGTLATYQAALARGVEAWLVKFQIAS